jgi:hypothetical protein
MSNDVQFVAHHEQALKLAVLGPSMDRAEVCASRLKVASIPIIVEVMGWTEKRAAKWYEETFER